MFIGYVLQVLLARWMGSAGLGDYLFALSWAQLLPVFGSLGLTISSLKFLPIYNQKQDWALLQGVVRAFITITLIGTSLLAFALAIIFTFSPPQDITYLVILIGLVIAPVMALRDLIEEMLRGLGAVISAYIPSRILQPIFVLFIACLLMLLTGNISSTQATLALLISVILAVLIQLVVLFRTLPSSVYNTKAKYDIPTWLSVALPLLLFKGAVVIKGRTDILMVGFLLGAESAGIYGAASKIASLAILILTAVTAIVVPRYAPLYDKGDNEQLEKLARSAARLSFIGSAAFLFLLVVASGILLGLFGEEFLQGRSVLYLLGFAHLINASVGPVGYLLAMTDKQRIMSSVFIATTIANILLNFLLIPIFGIEGAALATILSQCIATFGSYWYTRKYLNLDPFPIRFAVRGSV